MIMTHSEEVTQGWHFFGGSLPDKPQVSPTVILPDSTSSAPRAQFVPGTYCHEAHYAPRDTNYYCPFLFVLERHGEINNLPTIAWLLIRKTGNQLGRLGAN